jgi:hypothetical protein
VAARAPALLEAEGLAEQGDGGAEVLVREHGLTVVGGIERFASTGRSYVRFCRADGAGTASSGSRIPTTRGKATR